MSDVVIKVEGLGKRYELGAGRSGERYTALRDVIAGAAMKPLRAMGAKVGKWKSANGSSSLPSNLPTIEPSYSTSKNPTDFLSVERRFFRHQTRQSLGRNGAGKSTLLKILSMGQHSGDRKQWSHRIVT